MKTTIASPRRAGGIADTTIRSIVLGWLLLTSSAIADAPNVSLERHDEMIGWPAGPPWNGAALDSEYKDAQFSLDASGNSLLMYLPVTRTDDGHLQTLFRWNPATNQFADITGNLNIDTSVARDTYDADFADVDGDGDPDIVHSSPHGNFILVNDGADTFTDETSARLPAYLRTDCQNIWDDVVSGDLDGDGDIDLVFSNRTHNIGPAGCTDRRMWGPNAILYNDGTGVFGRTQILGKPDTEPFEDREGSSHGIEISDINNDGRLDLVISRERNYGDGVSNPSAADGMTAVQLEYRLNTGDTDGDGRIDWGSPVGIPTGGYSNNIETFDFDNDGDIDIFVARSGTDELHLNQWTETSGSTLFNSVASNTIDAPGSDNYSYDVSVGDLNNDGLLDIAVPDVDGGPTGANALYLNDGGNGFERSNDTMITSASPYFRLSVAFADVNLDNRIDMVWTGDDRDPDNEPPTVLLNTTAGGADTIAPRVENPTLLFSAGAPDAANFRVRITDSAPDLDDIDASFNWTAVGSMGTIVSAPSAAELGWAAKSTYQSRIACSVLTNGFQAGETLASLNGTVTAADGRTTPNSASVTLSSLGAAVPGNLASAFGSSAGSELAITIKEPTTTSPSVAQPSDGSGRLLVRVQLTGIDLQPDPANFTVTIGGLSAPVITGAVVANEMWLVVQTPATNLTSNLQVTYSPCGIAQSASMANAVVFTNSPIDSDTMFVVDRSGSMDDDRKMVSAKNAGSLWADTLRDNERVGVTWYAGASAGLGVAVTEFNIARAGDGTNRADAIDEIDDLVANGSTPLGTGLSTGLAELNTVPVGSRNDIRQIVLLSDGLENVPHFWSEPPPGWPMFGVINEPVIDLFMAPAGADVLIHTVSLGPDADHALMSNISALHGGKHLVVDLDPGDADVASLMPEFSLFDAAYAATPTAPGSTRLPNRLADIYEQLHNASTPQQRHWRGEFTVTRETPQIDVARVAAFDQTPRDFISFPMEPGMSFATVSVNWDRRLDEAVILVPDGTQAAGSVQQSQTTTNSVFRITNPVAGTDWRIGVPQKWAGTSVLVTVSGVSQTTGIFRQAIPTTIKDAANRGVRASTILDAGSPVTMLLALVDTNAIVGATVSGRSRDLQGNIESFTLTDDGIGADRNAGDGVYTGVFVDTAEGGPFNVEADATWVGTDGVARQRLFGSGVTLVELDTDGDHISDIRETNVGLDPNDPDDGGQDDDDDGLDNWKEVAFGIDPFAADTDDGGLGDQEEICLGLDPHDRSDDGTVTDSDSDGMPDRWEQRFSLDPNDPSDASEDSDGDGLSNRDEYRACTSPNHEDSDDDGLTDGDEVGQGLDPNDPVNRADGKTDTGDECPQCEQKNPWDYLWFWLLLILLLVLIVLLIWRKN